MNKFETWIEKYPKLENIYFWLWRNTIGRIENLWYECKEIYRKVFRGYSNREWYNFDIETAKYILPRLKHLKKHRHGTPADFADKEEKWEEILDKMIFSFEEIATQKLESTLYDKLFAEKEVSLIQKYHYDLKKLYKKIQVGLNLFGKHYLSLND
jgi:hypothetical protein